MSGSERTFSSLVIEAMTRIGHERGLTTSQFMDRIAFLESSAGANSIRQIAELSLGLSTASTSSILSFVGSIRSSFVGWFVVKEHFISNHSIIFYLNDNFKPWFLSKVEETKSETHLYYSDLLKGAVDKTIIAELGGEEKVETTITAIWFLVCQQARGGSGPLLTNGSANIFYVKDINGVLRVVRVHWHDGGWDVRAPRFAHPPVWGIGHRVFACNSCEVIYLKQT